MTTFYESKEDALRTGVFYAGFNDQDLKKVIEELNSQQPKTKHLGWPHDKTLETYRLQNVKGQDIEIGVSKFRSGYDLWLIDPNSGFAHRT